MDQWRSNTRQFFLHVKDNVKLQCPIAEIFEHVSVLQILLTFSSSKDFNLTQ